MRKDDRRRLVIEVDKGLLLHRLPDDDEAAWRVVERLVEIVPCPATWRTWSETQWAELNWSEHIHSKETR